MKNLAYFAGMATTLTLSLLIVLLLCAMSGIKAELTDTQAELDKVTHCLSALELKRAKDHNLKKDTLPMVIEYFRVHGLVSSNTTDAVFQSIYKEAVAVADQYSKIDADILLSIMAVESNFYTTCSSDSSRSLGLMQVQLQHHASRAAALNATDVFSIHDNILIGADYFAEMVDKYGCYSSALIAYNAGPSVANRYHKEGRMTKYATRVLSIYDDISKIGDTNE